MTAYSKQIAICEANFPKLKTSRDQMNTSLRNPSTPQEMNVIFVEKTFVLFDPESYAILTTVSRSVYCFPFWVRNLSIS